MLVIVKDQDGNEVATFEDVAKIVIDTDVAKGLVYEVTADWVEPAACSVTREYNLNDILEPQKRPVTP